MSKLPITKFDKTKFRSTTDSEHYNDFKERVFYDVVELFNMANELEAELEKTDYQMSMNGYFQQQSIERLQRDVIRVEKELEYQAANPNSKVTFVFPEDMQVDGTSDILERAYLDRQHHVVHLPIGGRLVSKTYLYDRVTDDIVVPDSLRAYAVPVEPPVQGVEIEDTEFKNAFTGEARKHWHRKIIYPLEHQVEADVTTEFIVSLPDTIISNRNVNMITLHPYPLNSLRINKIEYRMEEGSTWRLLPGWPTDDELGEPEPYSFARQLKFAFPTIAIQEIKVTMTQFNWVSEKNRKVYHFGIEELGVFEANYQAKLGKVNIPIRLGDTEGTFNVKECIPTFQNDNALTDQTANRSELFTYSIYTVDEEGKEEYVNDTFPITVTARQLLLKASLHIDPETLTTPILESVELSYEKTT